MGLKVSILIPCWNAARTVAQTIRSALDQTWPNVEVVAVDDGSTDDTLCILRSFESERVIVFSRPNQGAGPAKNWALREATGDFIQYLDSDDMLSPDKIEDQIRVMTEPGRESEIAFCRWSHFSRDDASDAHFLHFPRYHDYEDPLEMLCAMWSDDWMIPNHGWMIRRGLAERIGEWDGHVRDTRSFTDDFEYFTRALCAAKGAVRYAPNAKVYYRKGLSNSLSSRAPNRSIIEGQWSGLCRRVQTLLTRENSDRTRAAAASLYYRFIWAFDGKADDLVQDAWDRLKTLGHFPPPRLGGRAVQLTIRLLGFPKALALRRWTRARGRPR